MTTRTYCTILSTNYLPKALALGESLRRHEDGAVLKILFIDVDRADAAQKLEGVDCLSTEVLGLAHRDVLKLATGYDLVEFATAIKPLLLRALLRDAEEVFYLDPDTYVTAPMVELGPALAGSAGGILLTPHFLAPAPPGAQITDGHMLLVGVNNLGFCGVDRRALPFLEWWWGHLETECLYDPLSGLFVDQKWMDIGATLFQAGSLRHAGYNVGVANLSERPVSADSDGYFIATNGDRLRLFHFHAFDSSAPEKLSQRFRHSTEIGDDSAMFQLAKEYAQVLSGFEQSLPPAPPYPYDTDTLGTEIHRQLRRAYLRESQANDEPLPLPFLAEDAQAFRKWRRHAWRPISRGLLAEAARSVRIIVPEQYERVKKRFPKLASRLNDRFSSGTGLWG